MEEDGLERTLAHLLIAGEDHADDPEEDDVVSGDQNIRRIEVFQVFRLVRPAKRFERPECRAEPGIQCVRILMKVRASALRAPLRRLLGDNGLAAVIAVPRGDPVPPPELTRDAPVLDVVGPVEVGLLHGIRDELDIAVLHRPDGRLNEVIHLHEPLFLHHRFDGRAAAVMGSYVVGEVLDADEKSHRIEFLYDCLTGFVTVHSLILAAVLIDGGIVVKDIDDRKIVSLADLKVVRIMCRRDFDDTGSFRRIGVFIADNRNFAVHNRKPCIFADEIFIACIVRINCKRSIAEHRFRPGGRELEKTSLRNGSVVLDQRIFDMPEMALLLLILDFGIGNRSLALRAPVDDAVALVDPSLLMHLHENLRDGTIASLVHGETLTVPVTGRAELLELLYDAVAVNITPLPAFLKESLAAEVCLGDSLFLQLIDDLHFRRDGSVIGSRLPQSLVPLHAAETNNDVLHRLIECMAHVKLTGDIWRRNDNGKRLLAVVNNRMEVLLVFPVFIDAVLDSLRIVGFGEFLAHRG